MSAFDTFTVRNQQQAVRNEQRFGKSLNLTRGFPAPPLNKPDRPAS